MESGLTFEATGPQPLRRSRLLQLRVRVGRPVRFQSLVRMNRHEYLQVLLAVGIRPLFVVVHLTGRFGVLIGSSAEVEHRTVNRHESVGC